MPFCSQCGNQVNARYCTACGAESVVHEAASPVLAGPPVSSGTKGSPFGEAGYPRPSRTNWYFEVLKKYAVFGGRARRREYWYFFLFNFLVGMVIAMIVGFAAGLYGASTGTSVDDSTVEGIYDLYFLATLLPYLAVSVRRLHDTNRSGWWLLITFVPFIGGLILLFWFVEDSQPGPNRFGPNPKEMATSQLTNPSQ